MNLYYNRFLLKTRHNSLIHLYIYITNYFKYYYALLSQLFYYCLLYNGDILDI